MFLRLRFKYNLWLIVGFLMIFIVSVRYDFVFGGLMGFVLDLIILMWYYLGCKGLNVEFGVIVCVLKFKIVMNNVFFVIIC